MGDGLPEARVHLIVSGRVQGVFFRASTQRTARRLGLRGWVRNLSDGRVEAVAEGSAAACDDLVSFCREGPTGARVDAVEVERETPRGGFDGFDVRY